MPTFYTYMVEGERLYNIRKSVFIFVTFFAPFEFQRKHSYFLKLFNFLYIHSDFQQNRCLIVQPHAIDLCQKQKQKTFSELKSVPGKAHSNLELRKNIAKKHRHLRVLNKIPNPGIFLVSCFSNVTWFYIYFLALYEFFFQTVNLTLWFYPKD